MGHERTTVVSAEEDEGGKEGARVCRGLKRKTDVQNEIQQQKSVSPGSPPGFDTSLIMR